MTNSIVLDTSWDHAQDVAREMHTALGIDESQGRCTMTPYGNGWKIIVTRLDGKVLCRCTNVIPTDQELDKLYSAALAYGKASVHTSNVFRKAKHKQTPDVKKASAAERKVYLKMEKIRKDINERYPGLDLNCPAPHVGFTAEVDGYKSYVKKRLPNYVGHLFTVEHKEEINKLREELRALSPTLDYQVGDHVYDPAGLLYRVIRVTPKRRNVTAVFVPSEEPARIDGEYRIVPKPLVDRMLELHYSHQRVLVAAGLENS